MAGALISSLIEQLAPTALEKVKLDSEVEKSVEDFARNLKNIQFVVEAAEKRRLKEATMQVCLDELKDVAHEMDNVLDGWNTEVLKQQVENQEKENALVNQKKVRFFIPLPCNCFCFGQASRGIVVRHDIAQTIKELSITLTLIDEQIGRYVCQSTTTWDIDEPQSEIFGREMEKRILISKLLDHSTGKEERGPLVIPIVGMGGMGKSTLAQLVYHDEKVTAHFDKKIWVCVSDPFDEIKIAKNIIGNDDTPISDELEDVMQSVSKCVEGKRFLLALDDVWAEDDTKWKELKLALMSGAKGSRILVTTQKDTVARMMRATSHIFRLERLSEQDCLSLFYHIAFLDRKENKTDLFEAISNKIVKKCNGLPLAAQTLGSLVRFKDTPKEWEDVLNSGMWETKVVKEKIFRPLLRSYYDLASEIQRCLLFCASFPKNYHFEKDKLIELWMSQNYLDSKINKLDKRSIGQNYFDNLVRRSFLCDLEFDANGNLTRCKMDDIVHDFVQFLSRNECFIIEPNGASQAIELRSDRVHHLTLMLAAEGQVSLPTSFHTCNKLRSLAIFNKETTTLDGHLILQLKCLRALNLSKSNVKEVPKEIGKLLHLRYIDLSGNRFLKELPDDMCNLCNLETLHLEWCEGLEKLPGAMGKLISLKYLYVDHCTQLSCLPKGLGRLMGLQIPGKYAVARGGDDNKILELGDLE